MTRIDPDVDAFEVELRQSGVTLAVAPGRPVLDAVLEALPDHPWGCREGYCGACLTRVVEGTPDHRDQYLTAPERAAGTVMMICVSRACTGRLVLDL